MSDYLVTPVEAYWTNWLLLAEQAGVVIQDRDRRIGEAIFGHKPNVFPEAKPAVLVVRECFSPSSPSSYDERTTAGSKEHPAHPVALLSLMVGVGTEEEPAHREWTYRTVASTLLLAHPSGQVYTFMLDGGSEARPSWEGYFLEAGKRIGRSMYVHEVLDGVSRLSSYFTPNEGGKYGQYVTCFNR